MMLEGRKLTIGYRDRTVGRDLDVTLQRGEVLALLGPNGSGKTTLLKTLLGLISPHQGDVRIGERALNELFVCASARGSSPMCRNPISRRSPLPPKPSC